jgi:hypothetical protein
VFGGHAGDEHVHRLAVQQRLVAEDQRAVDGALQFGHRRCDEQWFLGQHVGRRADGAQRVGERRHLVGVAAVGHHRGGQRVLAGDLVQADLDHLCHLGGTAVPGLDREHHRGAEVRGDPRVDAQLAGGGDIGVVAADDEHRVALVGHPVVAVDDLADRGVGVLVQLLVTHADAVVVGQPGGGVGQQQFQDVVALRLV